MELLAQTHVSFPRELVFTTYRDRLAETVPYLPNVTSVVVESRQEEGERVKLVNLWVGKADVPPLARKFVKPSMLTWRDFAEWDKAGWICRWHIETHAFPGLMQCTGTTAFFEAGPSACDLKISADLQLHLEKAHVPRLLAGTIQPLVERVVVGALKPNLLSTGEGVGRWLEAQKR